MQLDAPTLPACIADDLDTGGELFPLSDVPDRPCVPRRGGKKLNRRIAYRWAVVGHAGVKLETRNSTIGRVTTDGALERFFAAMRDDDDPPPRPPTDAQRRKLAAAASERLDRFGLRNGRKRDAA